MKKSIGAQHTAFPAPVFVVGTYDPEGKPNVMTAHGEEFAALRRHASLFRYEKRHTRIEAF